MPKSLHILTELFGVRHLHDEHPVVREWDDFYDPSKELIPQAYDLANMMRDTELDFFAASLNHRITHAPMDITEHMWMAMAKNLGIERAVWHREEHPVYWKIANLPKSKWMSVAWMMHFAADTTPYEEFQKYLNTTWYEPIRPFLENTNNIQGKLIPQMKRRILSDTIEFPEEPWAYEFVLSTFKEDAIRFTDELVSLSYRIQTASDYFKPLYWFSLANVNLDRIAQANTSTEKKQIAKDLTDTLWKHLEAFSPSAWQMCIALMLNKDSRSLTLDKLLSAAEINKPMEFAEVKARLDIAKSLNEKECSIVELQQWLQKDKFIQHQDYTSLITDSP